MTNSYEFTAEQNSEFQSLANRMSGVGCVLVIVGLLGLLTAALTTAVIYRSDIPAAVFEKVPEDVMSDVNTRLADLPAKDQLWGVVANSGISGLIFFAVGIWTRSAGRAFRKIVKTENSDISHLMDGVGSLRKMYGVLYVPLLIAMLAIVGGLGFILYHQYMV